MLRLYFNKRGELPWSIDDGDRKNEKNFRQVFICNPDGVTKVRVFDPGEDPNLVPMAWIEFRSGALIVRRDGLAGIL